jgi:putative endonuclease
LEKGKGFEDIACEYLTSLGYRILHRNFYCRGGEIDIIALDGDVLVFVEVKGTTTTKSCGAHQL